MQHIAPRPNRRQVLASALGFAATPLGYSQVPAQPVPYVDETWQDARRQRAVPVRIRWPSSLAPADGWPVVIYSHGLGGSRAGGEVWGSAWAAAGFLVLHLQHAGSDFDAVMQALVKSRSRAGLQEVASAQQLLARIDDVVFAIDEIARRKNDDRAIDKAWRFVRTDGVGVAGHSFGAHTALGVGGQAYPQRGALREPRIAALVAFSPTLPAAGDAVRAFTAIQRPTLCLTGTRDDDVIGNGATADKRAAVYGALPAGHKAMLLLKDADHMTFGGGRGEAGQGQMRPREAATIQLQPQHHALVAMITTDWWRAHLMGDSQARARLQKPMGLAALDTWQTG